MHETNEDLLRFKLADTDKVESGSSSQRDEISSESSYLKHAAGYVPAPPEKLRGRVEQELCR